MNISLSQISNLQKQRFCDPFPADAVRHLYALPGERVSWQLCTRSDEGADAVLHLHAAFSDTLKLYVVKDVPMDLPARSDDLAGEDYITLTPGLMPDLLLPADLQNHRFYLSPRPVTFWIRADLPENLAPGEYEIRAVIRTEGGETAEAVMKLTVIPCVMPQQKLIYTRWFYADCIATQHHADIYSEKHWQLIDRYLAAASDMGINMILVPNHTPPLDTAEGTLRPNVQLVDIFYEDDQYRFDFTKFHRFIALCKKNRIRYYEMAHLFSQWGAKYAANIFVTENGSLKHLFGWHTKADAPEYYAFLRCYIPAIVRELEVEGIAAQTYFHISDEPDASHTEAYRTAADLIRPLIGRCRTMDALSSYEFFEKGLVRCPVTSVTHIHEFLEHSIPDQWVYYCCSPEKGFLNSFLAMPSYRVRILGFLLYKYDIKGFLHWGFNFYNTALSLYPVNPYLTTSCDGRYPSGDAYIVYPGEDEVYPSLRGEVLYDAIQDMNICFALEEKLGRESVIRLIDETAGRALRFDDYPRESSFTEKLREQMIQLLA